MQIIVTFGFFTLDDDMMSCVVQSDISEGNIVFFSPEKYFEYCFCLSTFSPIVYRPAQSYLQKLYNRNYNHRKISSHTYAMQ